MPPIGSIVACCRETAGCSRRRSLSRRRPTSIGSSPSRRRVTSCGPMTVRSSTIAGCTVEMLDSTWDMDAVRRGGTDVRVGRCAEPRLYGTQPRSHGAAWRLLPRSIDPSGYPFSGRGCGVCRATSRPEPVGASARPGRIGCCLLAEGPVARTAREAANDEHQRHHAAQRVPDPPEHGDADQPCRRRSRWSDHVREPLVGSGEARCRGEGSDASGHGHRHGRRCDGADERHAGSGRGARGAGFGGELLQRRGTGGTPDGDGLDREHGRSHGRQTRPSMACPSWMDR